MTGDTDLIRSFITAPTNTTPTSLIVAIADILDGDTPLGVAGTYSPTVGVRDRGAWDLTWLTSHALVTINAEIVFGLSSTSAGERVARTTARSSVRSLIDIARIETVGIEPKHDDRAERWLVPTEGESTVFFRGGGTLSFGKPHGHPSLGFHSPGLAKAIRRAWLASQPLK